MNEYDYSVETLIEAEDRGLLEPWGFEQFGYTIVEDSYEPAVVQKVESVLSPCGAQSISAVCEKSTEQLAYELGFGARLPFLQPYIQMASEVGLIESTDPIDKSLEYWKIAG